MVAVEKYEIIQIYSVIKQVQNYAIVALIQSFQKQKSFI